MDFYVWYWKVLILQFLVFICYNSFCFGALLKEQHEENIEEIYRVKPQFFNSDKSLIHPLLKIKDVGNNIHSNSLNRSLDNKIQGEGDLYTSSPASLVLASNDNINNTTTESAYQKSTIMVSRNEAEECSGDDDDFSGEENEEKFMSGVDTINKLSRDDYPKNIKFKSQPHEKKGIDLKFLQKMFEKKKNVFKGFEKNMTNILKAKFFEKLKEKIYNKESKLKIFESFQNLGDTQEKMLLKLVKEKLKHEEESVRYNITFPMFYTAVGTITLPYDDLVEPFQAWYAGELNMSRIDYYYGMDRTYQRGDIGKHGAFVKITPAHWKKEGSMDVNTMSCWYKEENKWSKRRGQTVVPMNIKKFQYLGLYRFNGVPTHKFAYQKKIGNKNNTYILHVTDSIPHKPLRYEMLGYDHLLRSHYDHYIIDYLSFEPWEFDYRVLQIPKEYKCYKQLEKLKSHFEANPMMDFLHEEDDARREIELNKTYSHYKQKHQKIYNDELENHKRKNIFRHNMRFIHSHNRAKLNFTLNLNHLSDISDEEFEMMRGQPNMDTPAIQKELTQIPQLRIEIPKGPLPDNLDWREYGAVTRVRSQSFCASCWAFSAVGAMEGAYAIKYHNLSELSVQQLIDCSWPYQNNGCRGGWSWRAFQFVTDHGLASQQSYGKYLAQEGYCHCDKKDKCDGIDKISYRTIQKHDKLKAKTAVAMYGPGSISVFSGRKTFKFYSSGIYDDPKCGHKTDHAVLLSGYGVDKNGHAYWLIKNSWGVFWGDNGFIKISMKNDLCGVLQNGALMVSLEDWKVVDSKEFPFKSMKKKVEEATVNFADDKTLIEEDIDFFSAPHYVTNYLQKRSTAKR